MKRLLSGVACIFTVMLVLTACNLQTGQPSTVPANPTTNQNVTGVFAGVKVAGPGQNATVNVQTAGGTQIYLISPNTTLTLGGKACSINELASIQAGNTSYNCTVVYNDQMGVFGVYVTGGTTK